MEIYSLHLQKKNPSNVLTMSYATISSTNAGNKLKLAPMLLCSTNILMSVCDVGGKITVCLQCSTKSA